MTTPRDRIHPDAVTIYDWLQAESHDDSFIGRTSQIDGWLDDMATDQLFRNYMQSIAIAAGRPKQWPTNELTIALTYDAEIRARARIPMPAPGKSRAKAVR